MPSLGRIYKDKGERWLIKLPGGIRIFCDKQHRTFYSRQHAEWTLHQIQAEIENGAFDETFYAKTKRSLRSFSVYALEWLENCTRRADRGELSPGYLKAIRGYVHNHWIPFFGELDMQEIRGHYLNKFYLRLELKPKSVWNCMAALHKLFKDALNEEIIQAMPKFPMEFRGNRLPQVEPPWAPEEIQDAIFRQIDDDRALFFIFFQATHATRNGESRALRHGDIDLENETVTIERAFSGSKLRPYPKGKRSRIIPLDPAWKTMYLEKGRGLPDGWVFTNQYGKPHGENWATRKWNAALEKAGISNLTLYQGTRHSLASQAGNRGVDIHIISKILGHSTLEQTKRYTHLAVNSLRQAQRKAGIEPLVSKASVKGQTEK